MNQPKEIDLTYSNWHRHVGWLYPAMDLDNIEIRDDKPIALIETTMCNSTGPDGAFNRFLHGLFQPETIWWVSAQLRIPAYVAAVQSTQAGDLERIYLLSFQNGKMNEFDPATYEEFLRNLTASSFDKRLSFPDLFDILSERYPGIKKHPYFRATHRERWLREYHEYWEELSTPSVKRAAPLHKTTGVVKQEITEGRPDVYTRFRETIDLDWVRIDWLEWRDISNSIGRPVAMIKSQLVGTKRDAERMYKTFLRSRQSRWWDIIATTMKMKWYYVGYTEDLASFFVWTEQSYFGDFNSEMYVRWIREL